MNSIATDSVSLPAVSAPRRLAAIDGWRAVACLLVLFHHTGFTLRWGPVMVWGFTGVHLFFVLSGYLLFRPFCKAILNNSPFNFREFYTRRLLRIYPPYLLAVIVFTFVRHATKLHPPSLHNLISHLLFASNSSNYQEFFGINPVFWTLTIEMQFYLVLPVVAFLTHLILPRRPVAAIYLTASLFLCVGLIARAMELSFSTGPGMTDRLVRFHTIFSYLDLFACGMFVAAAASTNLKFEQMRKRREWIQLLIGIFLFLLANAWCASVTGNGDWMESNFPFFLWAFPPLLCGGIAIALFIVVRGNNFLLSILSSRPLAYIGRISYSIYLFHVLVQLIMFKLLTLNFIHNYYLRTFCWGSISLVPTVILATGVYYLVEAPSLRLADLLKSRTVRVESVAEMGPVSVEQAKVSP